MRNLTTKVASWAQARQSHQEGQTAVEYAIVLAAVSIVLVGLLVGIGTGIVADAVAAVNGFSLG